MFMLPPVVVMPECLMSYATSSYLTHGGNISMRENRSVTSLFHTAQTDILCFIGGFCDTHYKVVWDAFSVAVRTQKREHYTMLYTSFNCYAFLRSFIPNLCNAGHRVFVISHSWGAKNILRLCLHDDSIALENLITLDCVGHFTITHRPKHIQTWENIYITDYSSVYSRANLAALIGGAKQYIAYADINTGVLPPANHASVATMLSSAQTMSFS